MRYPLIFTILFTAPSLIQADSIKIGYINIDHVVTSSPQFNQANKIVIEKFKPQERKLLLLKRNIELHIDQLNKNRDNLTQSKLRSEVNKIASLEIKLKQQALTLKKQLEFENKKELGKIQDLINKIIHKLAKEDRFDLILYQKVAYASKNINITSLISQKLRQRFE